MSRMNQDNNQKKDKEMNEEMTQQLLDQATGLVRTLADALKSTNGYTGDELEERINEYVNDALGFGTADINTMVTDEVNEAVENIEVDDKVEEAVNNMDMDQKVANAICDSDDILDEDSVRNLIHEVVSETDWYEVIQSNDIATEDWVEERIVERMNEHMFEYVQDFMMRFFKSETDRWLDDVRDHAITEHTIKNRKEEKQEEPVAAKVKAVTLLPEEGANE